MDILDFIKIVLPAGIIGYAIIMCILLASKNAAIEAPAERHAVIWNQKVSLVLHPALFVLCVLAVLHAVDYRICVLIVLAGILIFDRTLLARIDYGLLFTFVAFFLFVGNIERISAVKAALSSFIAGKAFLVSVLSSQVISNVPAAMMISRFTNDVKEVLLGVNVGGLGTPVASLASLISFKLYSKSRDSAPAKYLRVFIVYNVSILLLLAAAVFLYIKLGG